MVIDKIEQSKRRVYSNPVVWMKMLALIVFMVVGARLLEPITVTAASITGSPKLSIPNSSTEIGSDYTFVPTFGDNSTVSTFGSNKWRKINQNKEGRENWNHQWWAIDLNTAVASNANLKGKIGVKYTKVGNFNGQELDLMITLTGWGAYFQKTGNISFNTSDIEMYSQGYSAVDMEWRYVKSGTTTEVKVAGYLTFGDVDAAQGIRFNQTTSNNIKQVMIPSSSNKLLYTTYNGGYWYYVDSPYDTPEKDRSPLYRFTILYSGQSRLNLTWTVNYKNQGVTDKTAWGFDGNYNTTRANGQFFYYEYDKPARTAIAKPTKTVSTDNLGSKTTEQTIKNIYNTTKFIVKHNVPKEPSKYFFTNYKMTDTLHKGMTPTGTVLIKNQSGTNVTSWFDINKNGQTITASAKATTLKNNAFYGGTYEFIIDAKSVSAAKYDEFISGNKATVTNTATVTVNGKNYGSNEVKANMYKRTLTIKHVNKDTGVVLATETDKRYDGETPTYMARSDLKDSNSKAYRSLTANQKITVSKDETITFYYDSPRKITVNHVDNDTGKVINTVTDYKYESESYSYSPKTDLAFNSTHNYRVVSAFNKTLSGTVGKGDLILTFKYVGPRLVTVQHINKDTGAVLSKSTEYKYDGDTYSYAPKTDLVYDSTFKYKPATATQSGTINGKDVSVNLYYTGPRTITVNHVDKETGKVLQTSSERKQDGESYSYAPISTFKNAAGDAYKALTATQSGTLSGQNVTVTFYYTQPRTITVKHIDQETNKVLNTVTEKKYDGTAYSYSVKTDLVYSTTYMYKPVTTATQSGTVAGKDINLNFYYVSPRTITVNHVDKDTGTVLKTSSELKYDGETYSYAPITTFKNASGDAYKAVTATQAGTISGKNITVTLYYTQPRTITVQHIDQETNKILSSVIEKKHDGIAYSYGVKTDLVYNASFMYKPVTTTAQTGTVAGKDITLKFYYLSPRTIIINHVDDDDNKVLKSETERKHNGDKYSYAPKTDLKTSSGGAYKAVTATQSGIVNGNMTVTIRYTKPRTITILHKDDDDNRVIATDKINHYDGEAFTFKARTDLLDLTKDNYKSKTANVTGITKGDTTVDIRYIKRRLLTIEHIDKDTNKIIATSSNKADKKYDGEKWTFNARTDLKYKQDNVDYTYYPLAPESQSAITAGDLTGSKAIKFYYTKPSVDIGVKHVQIKTDKKAAGLPLILTIDAKILAENRWEDNSLRVKVTDKTGTVKLLTTQTKSLKEVAKDGFKWVIPASELAINEKNNYEVVIETIDAKKLVVNTAKAKIDTDGYTSSESSIDLTNNAAVGTVKDKAGKVIPGVTITRVDNERILAFRGVSMTERTIGQEMKLSYEMAQTTLNEDTVTPSGYGLELDQPISFSTEIKDDVLPDFTAKIIADNIISDGDYKAVTSTQHELTTTQKITDKDKLNRTIQFSFPKVTIDKGADGVVYTNGTPAGKSVYDGGSKMYVDVWPEKEDVDGKVHNFTVKTSAIGRHQVTFNITQRVTIESYMLGHLDSDTLKKDSLLVQPTKKSDDLFKNRQ